jgi:hypothetical protein
VRDGCAEKCWTLRRAERAAHASKRALLSLPGSDFRHLPRAASPPQRAPVGVPLTPDQSDSCASVSRQRRSHSCRYASNAVRVRHLAPPSLGKVRMRAIAASMASAAGATAERPSCQSAQMLCRPCDVRQRRQRCTLRCGCTDNSAYKSPHSVGPHTVECIAAGADTIAGSVSACLLCLLCLSACAPGGPSQFRTTLLQQAVARHPKSPVPRLAWAPAAALEGAARGPERLSQCLSNETEVVCDNLLSPLRKADGRAGRV